MEIKRKSIISGEVHIKEIDCTPEQIALWEGGMHIQDIMSHLSASDREFIISGITDEEWDGLFGGEEED